jgi:hypothetical protein
MGLVRLIHARKLLPEETLGTYTVMDDEQQIYRCCVVELPWKDNQHDISCIPAGTYWVEKYNDVKHPNTFWIKDVPERDGILIHPGNFATGKKVDTLGCQCPGLMFIDIDGNGTLDVAGSKQAMDALNYVLPQRFQIVIV